MQETTGIPILIVIGIVLAVGSFAGQLVRRLRLPSLMGFMLLGVLLGPSISGVIAEDMLEQLDFVTELALGFVALTIGLELSFRSLKQQGRSLVTVVLSESLLTFTIVTLAVFGITGKLPLALVFGAVAVTTAPAGKVAVIQETKAKGPLTKALLAVVGFDDAAAIVIFGFALTVTKHLLAAQLGQESASLIVSFATPVIEILLSLAIGAVVGFAIGILNRKLGKSQDVFIYTLATVFLIAGFAQILNISLVLTAMTVGIVIINTQPRSTAEQIGGHVTDVTPFMFVLFFAVAGAHLDLAALPQLGLVGLVYIGARSIGKIGGCWVGAKIGKADPNISRYLGIGILSQAGLSIGLAIIALHELGPMGPEAESLARTVIVTVTASSVIFELIGPALTRFSLTRAGETNTE